MAARYRPKLKDFTSDTDAALSDHLKAGLRRAEFLRYGEAVRRWHAGLGNASLIYRFEDCALDANRRELRRAGVLCPVEPQVFDLLEYLIRNRERVVSKDDVFKAVWHGRVVSEATLSTRMNAARHAIGDNGVEQRLIRTLRTKGFRFVGAVREQKKGVRPAGPAVEGHRSAASVFPDRPTIAVLPFINVSGDPRQEPFAYGLTEDLITALSKADWLFVVSRSSSFAYQGKAIATRQIARQLGVRYVLESSVRQVAGRLRIAALLIDGLTNHHLWAEHYDRDVADIFAVQDEITEKVVAAIEPQVYFAEDFRAQRKSLENLNAWECMVRALSLMNSRWKSHVVTARGLWHKAI
jgi:TolB-like protein